MQIEAKYTLGVPENKAWLNEQRDNLMNFGHAFPSRAVVRIGWAMTALHGGIATARRGLPAA